MDDTEQQRYGHPFHQHVNAASPRSQRRDAGYAAFYTSVPAWKDTSSSQNGSVKILIPIMDYDGEAMFIATFSNTKT